MTPPSSNKPIEWINTLLILFDFTILAVIVFQWVQMGDHDMVAQNITNRLALQRFIVADLLSLLMVPILAWVIQTSRSNWNRVTSTPWHTGLILFITGSFCFTAALFLGIKIHLSDGLMGTILAISLMRFIDCLTTNNQQSNHFRTWGVFFSWFWFIAFSLPLFFLVAFIFLEDNHPSGNFLAITFMAFSFYAFLLHDRLSQNPLTAGLVKPLAHMDDLSAPESDETISRLIPRNKSYWALISIAFFLPAFFIVLKGQDLSLISKTAFPHPFNNFGDLLSTLQTILLGLGFAMLLSAFLLTFHALDEEES